MADKGTRTAISAIAIEKMGSISSFSVVQLTYFPEMESAFLFQVIWRAECPRSCGHCNKRD